MDLRRIRELADAFDASDWDEIDLEIDGVRVRLSAEPAAPVPPAPGSDESSARAVRGDDAGVSGAPASDPAAAPGVDESSARARADGAEGGPVGDGGPADVPAQVPAGADGTPVTAPSPGIFWRAPSPGEPPFVDVGDRVEPDTVVCIVELMKLMNRVVAGVAGTVTAVLVDNGQPVDKGGSLVLVEPG